MVNVKNTNKTVVYGFCGNLLFIFFRSKLELSGFDDYTLSMKKISFVVFLLLFSLGARAESMQLSVSEIEAT